MKIEEDGSVTLTAEEWETITQGFIILDTYMTSMPFTFEDVLNDEQRVIYHKADCMATGEDYNPAEYNDPIDMNDIDDEDMEDIEPTS